MTAIEHTPHDDFPPHGYLDNPAHSWRLNPSGVPRSRPPLGMGWHVPNYGSYARNQFRYRLHLHVGIEVAGVRLLTEEGLVEAGVTVTCDTHTKNRLRYVVEHPAGARLTATYFLIEEHALGCQIELARGGVAGSEKSGLPVRLWLAQELAHYPGTSRSWEHGLYAALPGAREPATGALGLLGVAPEGDAYALGVAGADGARLRPGAAVEMREPWPLAVRSAREPEGMRTATLLLAYDLDVPAEGALVVRAALARDVSADRALARCGAALDGFATALGMREEEDEGFWARTPRLAGDWPGHWRRGWATDLETLRMVARPAIGVFGRRWDGMQIQAPRIVLAETALDARALAWAEPETAQELLQECFASAPRPNVPCMREDGSYNMVADDGAICGTGPEWGWPLAVMDALWRQTGDEHWLAAIYPGAAAYVEWWLAERTDGAGWPVHACSWESGQDVSTRFGEQSTGGSDVRHLRPVDLLAGLAQACRLLAAWAPALGKQAEAERWQGEAARLAGMLAEMWREGWFRDYDTRARRWSDVRDPMQLAPLAAGEGAEEQITMLRTTFDVLPPHCGVYPPLAWPPVAETALEAALVAGRGAWAAEAVYALVERVWRRMDARALEPDGAIPGVTREFWPEGGREVSAGIEGYGWGALTVHLLVRYVVGLREIAPTSFTLVPALPEALRHAGAEYTVGPLAYGAAHVTVTYRVPAEEADAEAVEVVVRVEGVPGAVVVAREDAAGGGRELARGDADARGVARLEWRGEWMRAVTVAW